MTTFQDPPHQSRRAVRRSEVRPDEPTEVDASVRPATARTGRRAQLPSSTEWQGSDSGDAARPTPPIEPFTLETRSIPQIPTYAAPASHAAPVAPDRVERPRPAPGRRVSLAAGEAAPTSAIPIIAAGTEPSSADVLAPEDASVTEDAPVAEDAPAAEAELSDDTVSTGETPSASDTEAANAEQTEPSDTESADAENADAEPTDAEPTDAEPTDAEPINAEAANTETANTEPANTEPADAGSTDTVPEVSAEPVAAAEPASPAEPEAPVVERTMTRRELREARVAAERAAGLDVPEAIGAILNSGTIILPYLSSGPTRRVDDANAEFDALTQPAGESEDEAEFPVAPVSTWDMPLEAPHHSDAATSDTDSTPELIEPLHSGSVAAPVEPAAPVDEDDDDAVDESDTVAPAAAIAPELRDDAPVPPIVEPDTTPASARSAGHWSVRADMDDDIESLENTITRTVGVNGAVTTNALVLPSVPQSSDITSPFTASGETMVTGSIDMPRSLGATGVHPGRVDTSDFDLDPHDHEVPSTDSAPVRAIRAVSTHTSSNGMVTSKKPQGNRMLTGMVVLASTMAVGVAGLLIAGFALQLFP
jgi:hypothetical protein